jgi:excisionase family DNA binding protein
MNDLQTVDELAKILKVPKSWIYSRTREKGADSIPRIKVGKYLRFDIKQVLNWLAEKYPNNSQVL